MTHASNAQPFKAETRQILDLVIHSLYSHKEIFLRELVSNASDAINKIRFNALTDPGLTSTGDFKIHLSVDKRNRTLTISDNGIGMDRDDLVTHLGTIAKSGTRDFLAHLKQGDNATSDELIGKFGVGFYASFMVADKVTVVTQKAGNDTAYRWTSTGGDGYLIEETERAGHGTDVILHLKPLEDRPKTGDEGEIGQDFTDEWALEQIVKKYSNFIPYPITMMVEKTEPELDSAGKPTEGKTKTSIVEKTLNSMKALWTKRKNDVTDAEYAEFYQQISHDWNPPAETIHVNAEGSLEYNALLFIPQKAPFNFLHNDERHNVSLYVRRVFVMDHCKELLPEYMRFVRGLVDSADLSLNVSREILQQDPTLRVISKHLTKKVLDTLASLKKDQAEKYLSFWTEFGTLIKEGFHTDFANKDKLIELLLFSSSHDKTKLTSLEDYVWRMPTDQKEIYYITGESVALVENSPHLEQLKAKGYEVLYLVDPIDEWVATGLTEYKEKKFKSAGKGELDLGSEEEKSTKKKEKKDQESKYSSLLALLKDTLGDKVSDVKLSDRLSTSVACLVSADGGITSNMERILKRAGQGAQLAGAPVKRVLELNPKHDLLALMQTLFEKDKTDPTLTDYANLLYAQALVADGEPIPDPATFSRQLTELMMRAGKK